MTSIKIKKLIKMSLYSLYDERLFHKNKKKKSNILSNLDRYNHIVKDLDFRNTVLTALNISIYNENDLEYDENSEKTFNDNNKTRFSESIMHEILQPKINKEKIENILQNTQIQDETLKTRIIDALTKHKDNLDAIDQAQRTNNEAQRTNNETKENLKKNINGYIKLFNKPGGISALGAIVIKKITQDDIEKTNTTNKNEDGIKKSRDTLSKYSSLKESKFLNLWMAKYVQINAEKKNTLIGAILQNQQHLYKNRIFKDRKIKLSNIINNRVAKSDNHQREFLLVKFLPNLTQISSKKFNKEFNDENNQIDNKSLIKTFATFYLLINQDFGLFIGGNDIFLQKNGKNIKFFGIDFGYKTIHNEKLKSFFNDEKNITKNDLIKFIKWTVRLRSFGFVPKIYKNIINKINLIPDTEFKNIIKEIKDQKELIEQIDELNNNQIDDNIEQQNNSLNIQQESLDDALKNNDLLNKNNKSSAIEKILKTFSILTTALGGLITLAIFLDAKQSIFNNELINALNIPKDGFAKGNWMIDIALISLASCIIIAIFPFKEKIPNCLKCNKQNDEGKNSYKVI